MLLRNDGFRSGHVQRLAGVHNALGARLAMDAGFDGVWASSLEIATSLGIPDADVLTWKQLVAICETIIKSTDSAMLVDCEAGFGEPRVVREWVSEFERIGAAGVCMEDAATPRRNSLLSGKHALADPAEFAKKIEAAVGIRRKLAVVARLQSLVASQGVDDALQRGQRYVDAGADAIVIHSRSESPDEVLEFVSRWHLDIPLVVIPTTYHAVTIDQLRESGKIAIVIYANHGVRASIAAIRRTFRQILDDGTSHGVESSIATVAETLALQCDVAKEASAWAK